MPSERAGAIRADPVRAGFLARHVPALAWVPRYPRAYLRRDLLASLSLWAVLVPQALAYAGIVGVRPEVGLYTVPLALIGYALLGTSRLLSVGPDATTALLSAVTVGALAAHGSASYALLVPALALCVALCFLALGVLRMGWVANFVPLPVLRAFIQGIVWVTILGQLPTLLGLAGGTGSFFQRAAELALRLPDAHPTTLAVGGTSLALLLAFRALAPSAPRGLLVVALATLASAGLDLADAGIAVVGPSQEGLPDLRWPAAPTSELVKLLPGALVIVLFGFAQSLGTARETAEKTGEEIDANQELVALGGANLGSSLCGGFPVVGGLTCTAIALGSGARTQVVALANAGLVALTLLFLVPLFRPLPETTLAALVIDAMLGLAGFGYLLEVRRVSAVDFVACAVAFVGVLVAGVLEGIGLGVAVSVLVLLYRTSYPPAASLGRIPGERMYRDVLRHPEARTVPGVLIFRFDSNLIFPNASHFRHEVMRHLSSAGEGTRSVLVDAETVSMVDATACEMLAKLAGALASRGVRLAFARVRDPVRQMLQASGVEALVGSGSFFETITGGVEALAALGAGDAPGPRPPMTA